MDCLTRFDQASANVHHMLLKLLAYGNETVFNRLVKLEKEGQIFKSVIDK
jgi:hypothetical protein